MTDSLCRKQKLADSFIPCDLKDEAQPSLFAAFISPDPENTFFFTFQSWLFAVEPATSYVKARRSNHSTNNGSPETNIACECALRVPSFNCKHSHLKRAFRCKWHISYCIATSDSNTALLHQTPTLKLAPRL